MDAKLLTVLAEPTNLIAVVGVILTAVGIPLVILLYVIPRRLRVSAFVKFSLFSLDPSKQPFVVHVVNKNTRQVSIEKIGFETFMRPLGFHEQIYCAGPNGLRGTEKLLVTESDHTEILFDGNAVVRDIALNVSPHVSSYHPKTFKIWVYLTHGSRVEVVIGSEAAQRFRTAVSAAVAAAANG
ncbi:hypothetical protein NHH82_00545 [Oxalobacteraceae bacterium OTU3REALA1]|nr:hypothetical protein NHH82_00545 [Oxalobacteraceae bacterium OTU3REALA1]